MSLVLKQQYRQQVLTILGPLTQEQQVRRMRRYIQHGTVTTYDHCLGVAVVAYALARTLRLPVNLRLLVVGAFLHDFYLYDWHAKGHGRLHGFRHPQIARENAEALLHQPEAVGKIIGAHMWPLTMRSVPTSLEGWLVCLADKTVTVQEIWSHWFHCVHAMAM